MIGNGFTGHLRVCQCDARLLQRSAAHECACLCACMSVYAFGRGHGDTSLDFPRLRSHLHPTPPTSLIVLPASVCGDQVFVIIISAPFRGGAVLAVIRVLAVLSSAPSFFLRRVIQSQIHHGSASRPSADAAGSCRCTTRSRLPGLVCAAVCWGVAVRLRNTLDES